MSRHDGLAAWLAQYAVLVEQETVPLLHTMLGQYSAESTNTSLQSLGDHSNIKHAVELFPISIIHHEQPENKKQKHKHDNAVY